MIQRNWLKQYWNKKIVTYYLEKKINIIYSYFNFFFITVYLYRLMLKIIKYIFFRSIVFNNILSTNSYFLIQLFYFVSDYIHLYFSLNSFLGLQYIKLHILENINVTYLLLNTKICLLYWDKIYKIFLTKKVVTMPGEKFSYCKQFSKFQRGVKNF